MVHASRPLLVVCLGVRKYEMLTRSRRTNGSTGSARRVMTRRMTSSHRACTTSAADRCFGVFWRLTIHIAPPLRRVMSGIWHTGRIWRLVPRHRMTSASPACDSEFLSWSSGNASSQSSMKSRSLPLHTRKYWFSQRQHLVGLYSLWQQSWIRFNLTTEHFWLLTSRGQLKAFKFDV